ncbi:MAG: hypothetical protein DBX59_06680 [Bacillota bacterium]|nr:MAG: hypothetical protein DBX59_06680 [Bacillota bacterium]
MVKKTENDWRLDTYDGYLDGAAFTLEKFASTKTNDHEHSIFCRQKITDLNIEDCDTEGYCTVDEQIGQSQWICKKCFNEFKSKFNFHVK